VASSRRCAAVHLPAVVAEHDGLGWGIIRRMPSFESAAPVKAFSRVSRGPQGRPLPGGALSNTLDNRMRAACGLSGPALCSRSCRGGDVPRDRPHGEPFASGGERAITSRACRV
jgi:hypothetical protein